MLDQLRKVVRGKVIVVGNGTSMSKGQRGNDIDLFDTVVRFNKAVTIGHEHCVGKKTDIVFVNSSRDAATCAAGNYGNTPRQYVLLRGSKPRDYKKAKKTLDDTGVSVFQIPLRKRYIGGYYDTDPSTKWISSGALAVRLLLQMCDRVTVCGFDGIETTQPKLGHYWTDRDRGIGHHSVNNDLRYLAHFLDRVDILGTGLTLADVHKDNPLIRDMDNMDNLDAARENERKKYDYIYIESGSKKYGHSAHFKPHAAKIRDLLADKTVVDVGTGHGEFVRWLDGLSNHRHIGVDFALPPELSPPQFHRWPAHSMGLSNEAFDYITSFDMLEHCLPTEVDDVLKEMRRVSRLGAIFTICYRKSRFKDKSGQLHLHPTVRPEPWWIERIHANMGPCVVVPDRGALFITYGQ